MFVRSVSLCSTLLLASSHLSAEPAPPPVDFAREVLPILSNKCFLCHGPSAEADQLRLDSYQAATADLGGYRAIDPDDLSESQLLERIHSSDDPMPPIDADKDLTIAERAILTRWVEQGGAYAKHWAFDPPKMAPVPRYQGAPSLPPESADAGRELVDSSDAKPGSATRDATADAIDAFVRERLSHHGVGLAQEADRATLARRVALTLTGLPPSPDQLAAYLTDTSDDAYERLVDSLLDSPQYGEHQARYWLDAVRYGDTHGLHLDNRRGIYPYRDWVVRVLNENLPIDQFIEWQLAGDLLPNPTVGQLIATGFVRLNPTTSEGGAIPAEFQMKNNFDRVETFGTVLLGMTLNCSRCHTHKYDPITQTEYYRLMAFFNSTAEPPMDGNKYQYGPTLRVPKDQHAWYEAEEVLGKRDALVREADAAFGKMTDLPGYVTAVATMVENPDRLATLPTYEMAEQWLTSDAETRFAQIADPTGLFAGRPIQAEAAGLLPRIAAVKEDMTTTLIARDLPKPRETRLLDRGEYDRPLGDPLEPDVLSVMGRLPDDAPRNRLGLARWLTDRSHPLVARVFMNRVWQRTFGHGLVRTTEDFGLQGEHPTHPALLDWLAVDFQNRGWDLKAMLRSMVLTKTFQQDSGWRDDLDDPENRLWGRGPGYRLDAEVIRDMALWSSGLLDPTMGGEGVKPYQPSGMWMAMAHPASNTKEYQRDHGSPLYRRSLYVYWKRTSPHPMMTLFDAPDRESSCVRRSRTSTALQSLGLLNETQRIEMGRTFAERLLRAGDDDDERLDMMFALIACREPTSLERDTCKRLLAQMLDRYAGDEDAALALLSQGDAQRDDSLDPAMHAAWTQVAVVTLASDLAILQY